MNLIKNDKMKRVRNWGIVVLGVLMAGSVAQAAVEIGVNKNFDGTAPHSSTTPWVDLAYQDIGNNTVQLTITAPNLSASEYLQTLRLNFNPTKNVTALVFTPVSFQGVSQNYSFATKEDGFQAADGAGGRYDITLAFATAGGQGQFNQGDKVVFNITTTQANTSLNSLDFAFLSTGTPGSTYYEAARIFGTGAHNNQDGWNGATTFTVIGAVPEPASGFTAAAACFAGLFGIKLTKRSARGLLA